MESNEPSRFRSSKTMRFRAALREGGCFVTFMAVVGLGFLIGSALFYTWGTSIEQNYQKYKQRQCTILSRQLLSTTRTADTGTNETYYLPFFKYTVRTADGSSYSSQGDTFLADGADHYNTSKGLQELILNRYAVGKTYPCWYNSTNPSQTVLSPTLDVSRTVTTENIAAIILLILGLIMFALLFSILLYLRRRKPPLVDEIEPVEEENEISYP